MKKIFLTFICSLISVCSICQTTEHLKFMGIPINGTSNAFTQKMKAKGFSRCPSDNPDLYDRYKGLSLIHI